MNINNIKSDTPTTSFINVYQVDEETTRQLNKLDKVLDNLRTLMDNQVRVGGLSINAYTIGGEAPLITGGHGVKVSAKTIYDDLDNLETKIKALKTSIPAKARKHKLEEYEVIKSKVSARIKVLEEEKATLKKSADSTNDPQKKTELMKKVQEKTTEIEKLKKDQATYNKKLNDYS